MNEARNTGTDQNQKASAQLPPVTPRRPSISTSSRLSLQTPGRASPSSTPSLDPSIGYSIARRPRLDFARACTSLHHSTLAEQRSTEVSHQSSGAFGGGATNSSGNLIDSPIGTYPPLSIYNTFPSSACASVDGSGADDNDTSTDDDDDLDPDLMVGSTAQTPISSMGSSIYFRQPLTLDASSSLMNSHQNIQAAVLRRNPKSSLRSRQVQNGSSLVAAADSSCVTPDPTIPPAVAGFLGTGYFSRLGTEDLSRRRDSLSQAIRDCFSLECDSKGTSEGGSGAGSGGMGVDEVKTGESNDPIKRVVTRRGNLLPKAKNFQRIKLALQEECSIVDTEVKREAEVNCLLREEDDAHTIKGFTLQPQLLPIQQTLEPEDLDDTTGEDESMGGGSELGVDSKNSTPFGNEDIANGFSRRAQGKLGLFHFDPSENLNSNSSPKYPSQRMNSDGDVVMASDSNSTVSSPAPVELKKLKRRRTQDERFEAPNNFKRRAVSPGVCGSPILTGSPSSSASGRGGKRLNFGQGISDTHDGLMKMSLQ